MNKGFWIIAMAWLLSSRAQAHVSDAIGITHGSEHLWLLLALVTVGVVLGPLLKSRNE